MKIRLLLFILFAVFGMNAQTTTNLPGSVYLGRTSTGALTPPTSVTDTVGNHVLIRRVSDGRVMKINWANLASIIANAGGVPTLNQVLLSGNVSDNSIVLNDGVDEIDYTPSVITHKKDSNATTIKFSDQTTSVDYWFPAKTANDTIAMLSDTDLQNVLTRGSAATISNPLTVTIADSSLNIDSSGASIYGANNATLQSGQNVYMSSNSGYGQISITSSGINLNAADSGSLTLQANDEIKLKTGSSFGFFDLDGLTGDRTYTLPNATGTLALVEDVIPKTSKFTVLPNVDVDDDVIGNTGLTYNTLTNEYVISYYSYAKASKLWFYHRNSPNLLSYTSTGTLTPTPDRELDLSAYLYHIQGVAYDEIDNTYWVLGALNAVSSNTERVIIHVDNDGYLLQKDTLTGMNFQAGMLSLNNIDNEFIIKPNASRDLYFLDKDDLSIKRTVTNMPNWEGLAFDPATKNIWIGSDDGYINVYSYDMELLGQSNFLSLKLDQAQNIEGMLLDPIDGKLLISFDGYLHGENNNGNALWKYDLGTSFYSQPTGYYGVMDDANKVTINGHFYVTATSANIPIAESGYIEVIAGHLGSSRLPVLIQKLTYFSNLKEFKRSLSLGVWTAWVETTGEVYSFAPSGRILVNGVEVTRVTSVAPTNIADGNAVVSNGGFYPFQNSSGSTNYPTNFGGGLNFQRSASTALGSFQIWKGATSDPNLYFRFGTDVSSFGSWEAIASKNYVIQGDLLKADLASPTFTGDPKAPTPTAGDNDTSIATTGFVAANVSKANNSNITATTTVTTSQFGTNGILYLTVNATSGAVTVNLPAASTWVGYTLRIIKTDSSGNGITVDANGSELINQSLTYPIGTQNQNAGFYSDGTTIRVIN